MEEDYVIILLHVVVHLHHFVLTTNVLLHQPRFLKKKNSIENNTFASKVATINDETADGSIGNVTGSNSVNVFLGIGLAWSVAAIYHAANGTKFLVEAGSLGFSVLIFCIEAVICIGVLMYRRYHKDIAGELGGPQNARKITSFVLVSLWFIYILLSALESYCYINHNL